MNTNKLIPSILIAIVLSMLTACSSSNETTTKETVNSYIINEGENKDIPIDSQIKSISTQQAQVKLTRDVEADITNVYVISGSVEVSE